MQNLSANIAFHIKSLFSKARRLATFSPRKRRSPALLATEAYHLDVGDMLLSAIKAWFTNSNGICATQIMSGTQLDIYHRISEHKFWAINKEIEEHGLMNVCFKRQTILHLKKYESKCNCFVFEILFY